MANCYFLKKDNDLIIIDPGDEFEEINNKIKNENLNLVAILITHAHFDHVGALDKLLKEYDVPVYYNNVNDEMSYSKLVNIRQENYNVSSFSFDVIYTKGHRNDSVTYYFKENNMMFTGDFLFNLSIGRMDLEYASFEDMKESIEKIKMYSDDIIIYPGHGEKSTIKYEKEFNPYLID